MYIRKILDKDGVLYLVEKFLNFANENNTNILETNDDFKRGLAVGQNMAYTHIAYIMEKIANTLM